jgi:hypothetical protein
MSRIGRTAGGSLLRSGQMQVGELKIREHAQGHYFASDVEVIGSQLLEHYVLFPTCRLLVSLSLSLSLSLSVLFLSADEIGS